MATSVNARRPASIAADAYERALSAGAILLMAAVLAALVRGRGAWQLIPATVWAHLATIMVALALTPVMLLRRRGDTLHRQLGWVWCAAMLLTALISFFVRDANHGNFSFIHILSAWVLVQVPLIVRAARAHDIKAYRLRVRAMVTGALLVAGFFTFPFNRLLGHWLFG
jgi:uncharacterized membrane protein